MKSRLEAISGSLPEMQIIHAKRVPDAKQTNLNRVKMIQSKHETARVVGD